MGEQGNVGELEKRKYHPSQVLIEQGKELTEGDESIFSEADSKRFSLIEMLSLFYLWPLRSLRL